MTGQQLFVHKDAIISCHIWYVFAYGTIIDVMIMNLNVYHNKYIDLIVILYEKNKTK